MLLVCAALAASPSVLAQVPASARGEAYYLFLHARRLEGEGDIDGAIAAHRRAIALAPDAAEVHAELAGLFARQNRVDEALSEGQAALALDPANREAHRILGFAFGSRVEGRGASSPETLENARKAVAHFERARAGGGGDPGAELTLGRLYVLVGEFDRAIAVLHEFLLDQSGYVEAILLLSDAYAGKGDTDGAIRTLTQVMDAQPGNARAGMQLAELYEKGGRWLESAAVLERLGAASPRMAAALAPRRATALINAGRHDEARAMLRRLADAAPEDAGLWYLLAQASLRSGALGEAEQAARRIDALDPNDPRGISTLADVLVARREFARALETLQPWIDRSVKGSLSSDADGLILPRAAQILGALGHEERAVEMLETLAQRAPDDADVTFELAAAYERAERHADAERLFREVVQADPSHALALNYLGYMLAERGERLDEAVSLISRALAIEPDNPSYQDSLGWAYFKQARYDLAVEQLSRAAASSADNSIIQDHYGDALSALKRHDEAIGAWQKALAGDRRDVEPAEIEKKILRARAIGK
jgi:tetratricopeptide (TPR) repeat protein